MPDSESAQKTTETTLLSTFVSKTTIVGNVTGPIYNGRLILVLRIRFLFHVLKVFPYKNYEDIRSYMIFEQFLHLR